MSNLLINSTHFSVRWMTILFFCQTILTFLGRRSSCLLCLEIWKRSWYQQDKTILGILITFSSKLFKQMKCCKIIKISRWAAQRKVILATARLNYWRHRILSLNRRVYLIKNCFVSGFYYRKLVGTNFEEKIDDNRYWYFQIDIIC